MLSEKNKQSATIITAIHYQYFRNIAHLKKNPATGKYSIDFLTSEQWKEIYFTPASAKFSQKPKKTDAGTIYQASLQFNVPGENAEDQPELEDLNSQKIIAKVKYSNGSILLIGTDKFPARFSDDFKADEKTTGSVVSITCNATKRLLYLDS